MNASQRATFAMDVRIVHAVGYPEQQYASFLLQRELAFPVR